MDKFRIGVGALALALCGCVADGNDGDRWVKALEGIENSSSVRAYGGQNLKVLDKRQTSSTQNGFGDVGSGRFVNGNASTVESTKTDDGKDGYTLNLVNAPIAQAAQKILADLMGYSFLVDPRVKGTITLQTTGPASQQAILDILESALAVNDAAIVKKDGRYEIVPISEALSSAEVSVASDSVPRGPGTRVQVIQLKHISAGEMANILEPITRKGAVLRVDNERNYIVVAGNATEISAAKESVSVFDVDWMKGMSVAILPLKSVQPKDVLGELNSIFGVQDGPNAKAIKFVPNARLNAVLVITSKPAYLQKAASWIKKLDNLAEASSDQMFVYEIQNRPAAELAKVLQRALATSFGEARSQTPALDNAVAPDLVAETLASEGGEDAASTEIPEASQTSQSSSTIPTVIADIDNNALLISASPQDYKRIERILHQLDVLPTQVFLEAIIAEITLNDELKFGLRWYLEQGNSGFSLSDLANGAIDASFPGFSWTRATRNSQLALSALSGVTNVKVISSPTLMVINNQKATLQVGDQVPIVTRNSTSTQTDAVIVNSVELRDTGIILSVTPRINSSGRVMLDIQQEVSNVVATTTSGIDSPTIQQRKIQTRVIVNDGESLALGGLIQEKKSRNEKKVPLLGDVPLLGNAFKAKTDGINRTELVIFIRPKIVRDVQEARDVTAEFRAQFDMGASETSQQRFKRDMKRLAF